VRVSVVKDGTDWKLDVPDSLTTERLQANLARELSRANQMKNQWPNDAAEAQRALAHHVMLAIMDQDSTSQQKTGGDRGTGSDRSNTGSDRSGAGSDRSGAGSDRTGTGGSSTGGGTTGGSSGTGAGSGAGTSGGTGTGR
jgi:hypothetical protein